MHLRILASCLAGSVVLGTAAEAAQPVHPRAAYVEGEVLVRYRAGPDRFQAKALQGLGLTVKRQLLDPRMQLLQLPAFMPVAGALDLLRADPGIELAEPNFRRYRRAATPDDSLFGEQWGLHSTGQLNFGTDDPALASVVGADLNMDQAWDANDDDTADRVGDPSVTVAVIDDAVQTDHPDLVDNIVGGFDFVNNDSNPNPDNDEEQHGTSVAGCVAARGNNGIGVAGVAWNVKLMPLKFGFDSASHIDALEFARANGAKIVNASFGGPGFSQAERDKIRSLIVDDLLFVAAAGNDDSNIDKGQLSYPANYDADNIVAVAATNRQDNIASFSQYGPVSVDVAAPGLQIVTTAPTLFGGSGYTTNPGISGTSFSAPYSAGVAALIRSHVAGVSYRDVRARLVESGSVVAGANARERTAGGRVDADRALEMAPGPSLTIRSIRVDPSGNGALDPGETANIEVVVENLWRPAANVVATLSAGGGVTVNTAPVALGAIATDGSATATYSITVPAGISGHRYVPMRLAIQADGGYSAERPFIEEVGRLTGGTTVTQDFAARDVDLYDEFHAWHFDLAQTADLTFTTTAPADVDILVKRGAAPQYNITVGINPETDEGFFCTSGTAANCMDPETFLGAGPDGNETVTIPNAPPGTYHVVVVNFAQLDAGLRYTLKASVSGVVGPGGGGGGGGGGALPLLLSLPLAVLALAHRRRAPHRPA